MKLNDSSLKHPYKQNQSAIPSGRVMPEFLPNHFVNPDTDCFLRNSINYRNAKRENEDQLMQRKSLISAKELNDTGVKHESYFVHPHAALEHMGGVARNLSKESRSFVA